MSAGSLKTVFFYQETMDQDLNFTLNDNSTCQAGTPPVSFACGQGTDVEAEGSGRALIAKLIWQPYENLQYYAQVGAGRYSLRVASVTVVNSLTGESPGFLGAIGVKGLIFPDTIVTPAFAVDASLGWQRYHFDQIQPTNIPGNNNTRQRLDITTVQLAFFASKRFEVDKRIKLEPYGGVKWLRLQSFLKDQGTGSRTSGIQNTVTPFVGTAVQIFEKEAFFVEASFVNGIQYSTGLTVQFK